MYKKIICIIIIYTAFVNFQVFASNNQNNGTGFENVNVKLQLKWFHQFQFAGYYAALEKGYYCQSGLNVEIIEGSPDINPIDEVLAFRADFGSTSNIILYQRLKGDPLVVLAVILQHSPLALLTKKDSGIKSPQDLIGRNLKIMQGIQDYEILAMFRNEGISLNQIHLIKGEYSINDLFNSEIDAFSIYTTNQPFYLKEKQIDFQIIYPQTYGIDFYGDCLFTCEAQIKKYPNRVKAFREASLKGWEYAIKNIDELVDLILNKYKSKKSKKHLLFEAKIMRELMYPDLIEIGHMNPGRWKHMTDTLVKLNMVDPQVTPGKFLYDPAPDQTFIKRIFYIAIIFALLAGFIAIISIVFNKKLSNRVKKRTDELAKSIKKNERIESELDIARTIQMGMVPEASAFPKSDKYELFAMLKTAKQVGGDLYDFFFVDEDNLCFVVGDVSDKGVPAAIFMAMTRTIINSSAQKNFSPAKVMTHVNNYLCKDNPGSMFVTLIIGVLDLKTGKIRYSNGGHNPPIIIGDSCYFKRDISGPFVGCFENIDYKEIYLKLNSGHAIFLYTDGITEAMNENKEELSEGSLLKKIREIRDLSMKNIISDVNQLVNKHAGKEPQSDDIAMLALKYL